MNKLRNLEIGILSREMQLGYDKSSVRNFNASHDKREIKVTVFDQEDFIDFATKNQLSYKQISKTEFLVSMEKYEPYFIN